MTTQLLKKHHKLLFRIGLSAFFLANSVTAWFMPDEFKSTLESNSLMAHIGHASLFVKVIGVNDGLLFLLILSGKYRKVVATWASLWLLGVIYVTGFWTTDFIEHIGILALLGYYALG